MVPDLRQLSCLCPLAKLQDASTKASIHSKFTKACTRKKKEPQGLPLVTGQDAYNLVIRLRLNIYSVYIYSRLELTDCKQKHQLYPSLRDPGYDGVYNHLWKRSMTGKSYLADLLSECIQIPYTRYQKEQNNLVIARITASTYIGVMGHVLL